MLLAEPVVPLLRELAAKEVVGVLFIQVVLIILVLFIEVIAARFFLALLVLEGLLGQRGL